MTEIVLTLLTGIGIAAASSLITVHLSVKQFRSQRLWEKKVETYQRIIEAFHKSKNYSSEYLTTEIKGRKVGEDREAELVKQSKEAHEEISKACDVGRFLLSDKAVSILDEFKKKYDNQPRYDTWWESLEENWSLTDHYMKEFTAEAQKDVHK